MKENRINQIYRALHENDQFRMAVFFVYEELIKKRHYGKITISGKEGKIYDYRREQNFKEDELKERYRKI